MDGGEGNSNNEERKESRKNAPDMKTKEPNTEEIREVKVKTVKMKEVSLI